MNADSDYMSVRYKESVSEQIPCYLCGKALGLKTTLDHIIPDNFFDENDPHRPKLYVHSSCNNKKSKDDQWFIRQIELRSYFDPRAKAKLSKLMDSAKKEKKDAYVVGRQIPNYKLARSMFDKAVWGMEFQYAGQRLVQLKISQPNAIRFQQYVAKMCQGLFIRNVANFNPSKPDLIMKQLADLNLRGKRIAFMETINALVKNAEGSKFGQRWGSRVSYIGSRVAETPNRGFLFIQFYAQFFILATFY